MKSKQLERDLSTQQKQTSMDYDYELARFIHFYKKHLEMELGFLDLDTVIKASQANSGEIHFENY